MRKNIARTAKKFIKHDLKYHVTNDAIIAYLKSIGYSVVFFDDKPNEILIKYDLVERSKEVDAFSFSKKNKKFIFLNRKTPETDQLYDLLHETGHILNGHLSSDRIKVSDRLDEMEAENFAYTALNYKKPQYWQWLTAAFCILVLSVCGIRYIYGNQPKENLPVITPNPPVLAAPESTVQPEENTISENMSDIVYITKTGKSYHRKSCRYTKDKDCTALSRAEAEKNYTPCKVCNP